MRKWILPVAFAAVALAAYGSGSAEAAAAAGGRAEYLAGLGVIVRPEEVHIDSCIASVDYLYPDPDGDFGAYLYTGHRQVSAQGQAELIHIGIQGKRHGYEELPPMNLAFVIDRSGSMAARHKMGC